MADVHHHRALDGLKALLAPGAILAASAVAYANSFFGPFVYDDLPSISGNRTIRHLWPLGRVMSPPAGGLAVSGRPMANASLAVNYAISGLRVWSYHAFNVAVHILAALTLFGIVRRTVGRCVGTGQARAAVPLALAAALLWALHPLQTESVTYVVGRTESLMGLWYLLTLYCFIRGSQPGSPRAARRLWYSLSVAACLSGMATKEVMVTAPLIVLLYDRTFVSGGFRSALRSRRSLYLGLAGTWLVLGLLIARNGSRGGTVGFAASIPWEDYARAQIQAVAHYLRLSLWPRPLVIDYGFWTEPVPGPGRALAAAVVALLLSATGLALWRYPKLGFLGAWFFVILAPSSSIIPIATEPVAEHRMYLPLAAVAVLAVFALYAGASRLLRGAGRGARPAWLCAVPCLAFAAKLGAMTAQRNEVYRSALTLWSATVQETPDNAGARNNLGDALLQQGDLKDAMEQYAEAVRISPGFAGARLNLENALLRAGRVDDALAQGEAAVRLAPGAAEVHRSLGNVLLRTGDLAAATAEYRDALRIDPQDPESHAYLGYVFGKTGRPADAVAEYREALRLKPDLLDARVNLGQAYLSGGRLREALGQFQAAVACAPDNEQAHWDLGLTLLALGRGQDARSEFEAARRLGQKH